MKTKLSDSINPKHYKKIAEAMIEEWSGRKDRRKDTVKIWDEIDRQLRMEPENSHKSFASGQPDPDRAWMPETELPLQAEALEVLTSEVRRLRYPRNRDWFQARAALSEDYIQKFQSAGPLFVGEKGEHPHAEMNSDNADKLVQGIMSHWHSQYDFRAHMNLLDAQALAYGFGPGRLTKVKARTLGHDKRKNAKSETIPVVVPRSSRRVYLDDSTHAVMHEGHIVGPNILQDKEVKKSDIMAAAKADPDGGWIEDEIKRLRPGKDDAIELVEMEGDLVYDDGMTSVIQRDVVIMVAIAKSDAGRQSSYGLVRAREGIGQCSYIILDYHIEHPESPYGSSPLMKGMPIARSAAQALNRVIESGQLKNAPPLGYPNDSVVYAGEGGPRIHPNAVWQTIDDIRVYSEIGGEPQVLFEIFTGLMQMYSDVTGVTPSRLGAQTKSHTTAFAKDVENQRGSERTVDYVQSTLEGAMTRLLDMEYRLGTSMMGSKSEIVYIEDWNDFVQLKRGHLPDVVKFIASGAGAPIEEQQREAQMLAAIQTAMQVDAFAIQMGRESKLNHGEIIEQILARGGWSNFNSLVTGEGTVEEFAGQPGVGGASQQIGALTGIPASLDS